ncbi:uncharacterized protein [Chelonus insularis]|uniref:uncharacterized protein n=1 Tax=Chelonus insularis TaxID=460826 RepID=UPI001589FB34|nr:uncharacterized protein LOC118066373 [Chelonus insularis]
MEKKIFCAILALCTRLVIKSIAREQRNHFAKKDVDAGIHVDIEDAEEINNLDNINVLLVPIYQEFIIPSTSQSCAAEELAGNSEVKVVYTEPFMASVDVQHKFYPDHAETDKENDIEGIVRKQLSAWIRNHRAYLKTQAAKRDKDGKILSRASVEVKEINQIDDADIQRALRELQKNHSERNLPHVKKLLKITLPQRHQWI